MKDKFLKTIENHNLINKGDVIVVGVSGGPDSMCLLHLLYTIRDEWSLKLHAVHLNHEYRGALSDADADYVAEKCQEWTIPLHNFSSNVEAVANQLKTSFEDAGRRERYRLFFKVKEEVKAQKIAVAQNKNDQAETVLMRLIRGSGLEGLSGIEYKRNDGVIRPVLDFSRLEIEAYCEAHGLNPRIDHTNEDVKYTRNKIRKDILQKMQEINPSVIDQIVKTSGLIKSENSFIEKLSDEAFITTVKREDTSLSIDLNVFNELEDTLKRRVLRKCIEDLRGHLKDVSFDEIESVIHLATLKKTGNKKTYHKALTFEVSYDKLIVYLGKRKLLGMNYALEIKEMTGEEYKQYSLLSHEIAVDKNKISGTLLINTRKTGDKFHPIGLNGQKKVKDFFIDKKIPREERDSIPIVRDDEGIVWIFGYRQDRRYLVDENTSKVLILQCIKLLTN